MKKRKLIIISTLIIILIVLSAIFYIITSKKSNITNNNNELTNNGYTQLDKNEIQYQENTTIEDLKEQTGITRKQWHIWNTKRIWWKKSFNSKSRCEI